MQKVSNILNKCFGYNSALLSGSMDIIVIKQPNGKFKATPLRLRFSNYRVPKAGRKKVIVKVNGKLVNAPMFLQKDGKAFILSEKKKNKENKEKDNIEINRSKSLYHNNNELEKINQNINKIFIENENNKQKSLYLSPSPKKNKNNQMDCMMNNMDINATTKNNNINININNINNDDEKNEEDNNIIIENDDSPNNIKLELSDCWDIISKNKYNKNFNIQEEFYKKIVNKEEFFKDPWKIIKNPNIAFKYGNKILTSKVVIPMMFSQLIYGCSLPEEVINNLTESQGGLFFWKSKHKDSYSIDLNKSPISKEKYTYFSNYNSDGDLPNLSKHKKREYNMKKSSKFPSHILEKFDLKEGKNEIEFIVDGFTVSSNIYLWNYTDKIVISDFDGTVTRSDVIGQIGVYFGIDWTHKYIAKFYSHISNNGYKFLYLTARTMYMQGPTKNSLYCINQNGFYMPYGPMMMNDSGFVNSLKTEIIDKVPQEFKIECLFNVLKLFPPEIEPFYAGFGNNNSDKFAYEKVGLNPAKIFIINEKGEISRNDTNTKTNFLIMDQQINELFPLVNEKACNDTLCSDNVKNMNNPELKTLDDEKKLEEDIKEI